MKIEKLSENKLKVTLSPEDMLKWNITYDTLLPDNPDTNSLFWDIIHKATKQTGMKFENCRLTVEAMQQDKNTYIMIITKRELCEKKPERYKFSRRKRNPASEKSVIIYSFSGINDVINFAKNNLSYCFLFDGKNTLYRDEDKLMLVLRLTDELEEYLLSFDDRICEYADFKNRSKLYVSYLNEYANIILKDSALKTIYYKM